MSACGDKQTLASERVTSAYDPNQTLFNDEIEGRCGAAFDWGRRRAPEVTAVFASSDELALELIEVARQRNVRLPHDLSIIGFDDIPDVALSDPPLTTIVQPTVEKGRAAARMLFDSGPPIHVVLPVQLVVRSSTGPPRS